MTEHESEQRLRDLGRQPIDAATKAAHLRRIKDAGVVADTRRRRRFGVVSVAAAGVVGFLAGSTGLAMADALPDPAQQVAHDVLGAVQVDVPAGKEGKRGPCVSEAAKIKDKDAKRAAMDACPKGGPDTSGTDGEGNGTGAGGSHGKSDEPHGRSDQAPGHNGDGSPGKGAGSSNHAGDPCHGRPPWAGPMSKEQRDAAKAAASRDACPDDGADVEADDDAATPAPGGSDQPSTTVAPARPDTTTAVTTTTTVEAPEPSGADDPTSINPSETTDEESTTDASSSTPDDSTDG